MLDSNAVHQLAKLARISLREEEESELAKDLGGILTYVGEVNKIVTENLVPTAGALRNVFREDKEKEGGSYTEAILNNAPDTQAGYVKVPKIL